MNSNDNTPPVMSISLHPDFGDVETLMNMRNWFERVFVNNGAQVFGAGIGCGGADLQVSIEGHLFNVSIRPMTRAAE